MSATDTFPLPEVVIGHHPDHGIVASLPTQSAAAQWMLEHLEFERVPGRPSLYSLTDQDREASARAAWAVKLLIGAGYRVDADLSLTSAPAAEQAPVRSAAASPPERGPERELDPDVVFAEHPRLGLIAALGGAAPLGPAVALETGGWRHHPALDVYFPAAATRTESLDAVARTTAALQRANYQVAVEPQLADEIATHHASNDSAFTTRKFSVDETAIAKEPARHPVPDTASTALIDSRPPTAVDPRIAFARVR